MSEFKPMLAAKTEDSKITFPKLASPKLDGIRAIVLNGKVLSRTLKPIPNKHVQALFGKSEYEGLDGELIVGAPNDPDVYRATNSGVMSIEGEPDVKLFVFDCTPDSPCLAATDGWFANRLASLVPFNADQLVRPVPHKLINNLNEMNAFEDEILGQGYEGIMLRNPLGKYKFGRATPKEQDLLKVKREEDAEGKIVGVYEALENQNEALTNELGRTKRSTNAEGLVPKDTLGGFVLEMDGVQFNCGCGKFNHDERKQLWDQRETLPGKFIKFRFFKHGVKVQEDGTWKPRHPRALGFRDPIDFLE